jgi:hypothetical protein
VTFEKGDRVEVRFEGVVDSAYPEGVDVVFNGSWYWVTDLSTITKIEKVYPAGSVWVWFDNVGEVDAIKAAGSYTKTDFAAFIANLDSPDQIIAIHEPE